MNEQMPLFARKVRNKTIMRHSRLVGALLYAAGIGTILAIAPSAFAAPLPTAPALAERADDGAALLRKAARLEADGKYEQAADAYDKASKAFEAEGKSGEQAKALSKMASALEKQADQLTKGGKAAPPAKQKPAAPPNAARAAQNRPPPPEAKPIPKTTDGGAYAPGFHIGDAIEADVVGTYYAAKILDIKPSGGALFGIQIRYAPPGPYGNDKLETWTGPGWIRHAGGKLAALALEARKGPRMGRYNMYAWGAGTSRIFLGYFDLSGGGVYKAARPGATGYYGSGTYSFDAGAMNVRWLTGPFKADGWTGIFTIERDGKTHQIRMKRNTLGLNNTD